LIFGLPVFVTKVGKRS